MRFAFPAIALLCLSATAYGAEPKSITLTNAHEPYVVPEGHVWKVERLKPYESEKGVGTSDLSIEGAAQIGQHRECNLDGKFDFTLGAKQRTPLWILAGSKVGVGDSRGTVVVEDYKVR
jgi:hypothetical protein